MERQIEFMKTPEAAQTPVLTALKLLYASFSDEQKKTADELLRGGHLGGGRFGGHGPRYHDGPTKRLPLRPRLREPAAAFNSPAAMLQEAGGGFFIGALPDVARRPRRRLWLAEHRRDCPCHGCARARPVWSEDRQVGTLGLTRGRDALHAF